MPPIPALALIDACRSGDVAAVSRLLPAGGTPRDLSAQRFQDTHDRHKNTPLTLAASYGHIEIVRMILARAPNTTLDYGNATGGTALNLAATKHNADIIRLLVERGANVSSTSLQWMSPLIRAVTYYPARRRDPDPDGSRQLSTVMALLQLDAGTIPPPPHPAPPAHPFSDSCLLRSVSAV